MINTSATGTRKVSNMQKQFVKVVCSAKIYGFCRCSKYFNFTAHIGAFLKSSASGDRPAPVPNPLASFLISSLCTTKPIRKNESQYKNIS